MLSTAHTSFIYHVETKGLGKNSTGQIRATQKPRVCFLVKRSPGSQKSRRISSAFFPMSLGITPLSTHRLPVQ